MDKDYKAKKKAKTIKRLKHQALVMMPYCLLRFLIEKRLLHQFVTSYAIFRVEQRQGIALSASHFRDPKIFDLAFNWSDANLYLNTTIPWQAINQEYLYYYHAA